MANGNLGGPAAWVAEQQTRRDEQIRQILNLFILGQRQKEERGWQKREWENKLTQQAQGQKNVERGYGLEQERADISRAGLEQRGVPDIPSAIQELIFAEGGDVRKAQELARKKLEPTPKQTPGEAGAIQEAREKARAKYRPAKDELEKEYRLEVNKIKSSAESARRSLARAKASASAGVGVYLDRLNPDPDKPFREALAEIKMNEEAAIKDLGIRYGKKNPGTPQGATAKNGEIVSDDQGNRYRIVNGKPILIGK